MASGPVIGLDIGSQQVKAVELRPVKGRLCVSGVGIAPTPFGVVQNNIITDARLMGQTVKQLMKEGGLTAKRIVLSVAGTAAVVVRVIEVPRMTDAELKETMKWEVERHVPFAPTETVMDYQPLKTPAGMPETENMDVLLAVAQNDVVTNAVQTVFAAGLDPVAIDIEPLAVGRGLLDMLDGKPIVRTESEPTIDEFGELQPAPAELLAIVNIGASNTDISIYRDGQLTFPRSLPLAGDSLTRAIAETLGYTLEQAERAKQDYATIQLERMALYTGTAYGDDAGYDPPQFQEDEPAFEHQEAAPQPDPTLGVMMHNPFDLTDEEPAEPASAATTGPEGPQFDEPNRTQPIPQRTLNLARRPEASAFGSPFGADGGFGAFAGMGAADESTLRDQVFEAIAPVLGELVTELRRSLDYYRTRAGGGSVDRLYLVGGTAMLPNITTFLQNELQLPVVIGNPLSGFGVAMKKYDPAYLDSIAPVFAVAAGLAAREAVLAANPLPKQAKAPRPVAAEGAQKPAKGGLKIKLGKKDAG